MFDRPNPRSEAALLCVAGLLAAFGLIFLIAGRDEAGRGSAIAVGLILCAVAYAIEYLRPNIVFTSNIALLTVGTPILWLGVFLGEDSGGGALAVAMLFTAATLGCVYLFDPRFIGVTPLLGVATAAAWLMLVFATIGSDALDTGDPLGSASSASSSASWLSLIIGAVYLAVTAQLDRRNLRAAGTGFAVSGLWAFASGATGVVTDIEAGGAAKALMIIAAGCWLSRVGHMGGRRVTTWTGALGVLVGAVVFAVDVAENPQGGGIIALVAAGIVAAVALNLSKIAGLLGGIYLRTVHKPEPALNFHCSKCDTVIAESAKFCPSCGDAFDDNSCPSCGTKTSKGANFCDECGADLKTEA
jgi:RNA polymerase subunit RPABC4/transcription elongation factor Spt4